MTFYLVAFIAYTCPGGWLSGLVPAAARPFVCRQEIRVEAMDRLDRARSKVVEQGQGTTLVECRGLRCTTMPVTWTTEAHF